MADIFEMYLKALIRVFSVFVEFKVFFARIVE